MELAELTHDETLVLVGFMRVVIQADGAFSDEEREYVDMVRQALGTERFTEAMREATRGFPDNATLKTAAKAVTRAAARDAIYQVLLTIAASDTISKEEDKPLRWIESWWEIARS